MSSTPTFSISDEHREIIIRHLSEMMAITAPIAAKVRSSRSQDDAHSQPTALFPSPARSSSTFSPGLPPATQSPFEESPGDAEHAQEQRTAPPRPYGQLLADLHIRVTQDASSASDTFAPSAASIISPSPPHASISPASSFSDPSRSTSAPLHSIPSHWSTPSSLSSSQASSASLSANSTSSHALTARASTSAPPRASQCPPSSAPYTSTSESSLSASSIAARSTASPSPSLTFARSFFDDAPPSTPARLAHRSTRSLPAISFRRSSGLAAGGIGDDANGAGAGRMTSALVALRRIGCEWSRARGWVLRAARERERTAPVESPFPISMPLTTRSAMSQEPSRTSVPTSVLRSPACALSDTTSVLTSVLKSYAPEGSTDPITPPTSSRSLNITSELGMETPCTLLSLPHGASSCPSPPSSTLPLILQSVSPASPPSTSLIASSSLSSPSPRPPPSLAGPARSTTLAFTIDRVGAAWVSARRELNAAASSSLISPSAASMTSVVSSILGPALNSSSNQRPESSSQDSSSPTPFLAATSMTQQRLLPPPLSAPLPISGLVFGRDVMRTRFSSVEAVTHIMESVEAAVDRVRTAWMRLRAELLHIPRDVQHAQAATSRALWTWQTARAAIGCSRHVPHLAP
ncbi:hypothetical protein CF326_g8738 [Tilletia indica]|nr:hypothetical protein CF326_g8738 [Tilletia indica]